MPGPRGLLALAVLALATVVMIPVQMLAVRFGWPLAGRLPVVWHRMALALIDVRVRVHGAPTAARPLLLVANHASWLDILMLASRMPLAFVAKSEVAAWPVFGLLARLQRSVFIDRSRRADTGRATGEMAARMAAGETIVLFAEGTTSDGNQVLPFRSALLGAARAALAEGAAEVAVQPVAVAYTHRQGMPFGRQGRALVAWPGDVPLMPHLLRLVGVGAVDVAIAFGTPRPFAATTDRKRLAALLEADVRAMVVALNAGRDPLAGH